ncbi:efflux RND transporter periplasmic adaptor subunit [Aliikangiella maris]|uniref:Efflux RND transporter periplasmic adaptor subunit n=2 Tax=Aliikangiella maris TaxID=3162458 RepID=A0ABV3MP20_9GAMM
MFNSKLQSQIFLTLILATLLISCNQQQKTEIKEVILRPVRTMQIHATSVNPLHEFTAVVDASKKADLSFKISGELIELPVKQGDRVKTGQVIARLDDKDILIQLDEAKSTYHKASSDFNRAKDLLKTNHISQSDYDLLKAQFNSAKAKLETAENNLAYTRLKASFEGVVAKKYVENFEEVTVTQPIIALHDLSYLNLKIDVPESIMINVKKQSERPTAIAVFDAIDDIEFPLTFKEISTQADEVTKTYEVTYTMPAPTAYTILPGMTARVMGRRILDKKQPEIFYLPPSTVLKDKQGHYVFIVVPVENNKGKIQRKPVSIGEITPFGLEIFSGVDNGDSLLTAGMSKVTNGQLVKL